MVDRKFQLKYILLLVSIGATISLLFGALMYYAHLDSIRAIGIPEQYKSNIDVRNNSFLWLILAISSMMTLALAFSGIVITHHIAGPMHVFSRYLEILQTGRYPTIRSLRKHDEFKRFHEQFSMAINALRERALAEADFSRNLANELALVAKKIPSAAEDLAPIERELRDFYAKSLERAASE